MAKGEIQEQLAAAVQRERAAAKKLDEAAAEADSTRSRLARAETALQVRLTSRILGNPNPKCNFECATTQAFQFLSDICSHEKSCNYLSQS